MLATEFFGWHFVEHGVLERQLANRAWPSAVDEPDSPSIGQGLRIVFPTQHEKRRPVAAPQRPDNSRRIPQKGERAALQTDTEAHVRVANDALSTAARASLASDRPCAEVRVPVLPGPRDSRQFMHRSG